MVLIYQSLVRHKAGPWDWPRRILGMSNELTQSSPLQAAKTQGEGKKKQQAGQLASLLQRASTPGLAQVFHRISILPRAPPTAALLSTGACSPPWCFLKHLFKNTSKWNAFASADCINYGLPSARGAAEELPAGLCRHQPAGVASGCVGPRWTRSTPHPQRGFWHLTSSRGVASTATKRDKLRAVNHSATRVRERALARTASCP